MWALLGERNFRWLWLGQLCSQFGDRLTQLVLVALVTTRASGSTFSLAKVLVWTSLPALLVNPIAGAYVDRWDRKRTMIVCDLIRMATIVALPWLVGWQSQIPLYAAIFVIFSVASFFVPARLAMIPDVVPPGRLAQANAIFTSSGMIGSTVILLVGALMVEWFGAGRSALVNAASYAASAAFIVPIVRKPGGGGGSRASARLIAVEICEGIRQLWQHAATRRIVGLLGLLMAGAGASLVLGTVLVQRSLHTVTKDLGFLSLWLGVGMLGGSLAYGRWATHWLKGRVLGLAFLGTGFALWFFVAAAEMLQSRWAVSLSGGCLGFFLAPVGIVTNTLVHEAHSEALHGRIFSSLGVVVNSAFICSMLTAGWLGERWSESVLLAGIAAAFAVGGLALLYYRRGQQG